MPESADLKLGLWKKGQRKSQNYPIDKRGNFLIKVSKIAKMIRFKTLKYGLILALSMGEGASCNSSNIILNKGMETGDLTRSAALIPVAQLPHKSA